MINKKKDFYRYKGIENAIIDYIYPELNYTISASDIINIT